MILSFFDQFMSPTLLGVPLLAMAISAPLVSLAKPTQQWLDSRVTTMQTWLLLNFTKQLMAPLTLSGQKWATILTSLMMFLITMNLLGLLPYTFTPTTQLSMNMALAVPMWLATVLLGMRSQPTTSFAHLLPEGTPTLLIPPLIMIETISLFIRPLALGVRLTANLTAGHLLIQLTATAAMVLLPIMPTTALLTAAVLFLLTILEVAVAMIQAYVFVLPLSLYLQENI
ncbi:ATP synthase F0 subunit 6 (mitochondrion) [Rhinatrema bivittatum]|uniref:ATP synthase subunit a n=1 Tax=Rhinatrema bivittatum TaxID=194408 RepID=Q64JR6_RHIBI|nr:ATP synthase F0 subunit 6 [Rhinatrema bivittatum]AAS13723.1 ATP synthase F0 subunit 6 [Rhinatrema bivittatum]